MLIKRSHGLAATALLLTFAMAGCGGSSGNGSSVAGGGGAGVQASDSFFNSTLTMVNTAPDNIEPAAIDSIAATSPDNTEPTAMN
jgi:hypothetical protein